MAATTAETVVAVVADETSVSAMSIVADWAAMAAAVTSQLLWLLNFYDFAADETSVAAMSTVAAAAVISEADAVAA